MPADMAHPISERRVKADPVLWLVRCAIIVALAGMAAMSWTRNINWDEFYFLSHVHAYAGGRLDLALQTGFVHAFGWLVHVPGNEIGQITAARLVMLGCFGATALAIYRVASELTEKRTALIAVLAFVTSGFAIPHGSSFRADPIATAVLMWAFALIMTTQMRGPQMAVVAALGAAAVLVTVKAGLYLPVMLAAMIWRGSERGVVYRSLIAGVFAVLLAAALFLVHQSGLATPEGQSGAKLTEAASVTMGGGTVFPRWPETALWLVLSAGALALVASGATAIRSWKGALLLLGCAAPLLIVVVYRNAFPYYFPFAAAPIMVFVALGAAAVWDKPVFKAALILMVLSGGWQSYRAASETLGPQSATIAEVHRLFPEPVPYIDQNAMIASFPRHGFFMSTWGLATYRAAGVPIFADLIASQHPKFMLANRAELRAALDPNAPPALGLLEEDIAALRAAYVHHAGAIWLAGQEAILTGGQAELNMPFAGRYRLEASAGVMINGQAVDPGAVLELPSGGVTVAGPTNAQVRLVWATAATGPAPDLPEDGLYAGFWRL